MDRAWIPLVTNVPLAKVNDTICKWHESALGFLWEEIAKNKHHFVLKNGE